MADPVTAAAIASAGAAAVSAGASVAATANSFENNGYRVNCFIEIENWTRFPLTYPEVELHYGNLHTPPIPVLPSKREAMLAHKTEGLATGSSGTVSWLLEGIDRRVVVMWSAPFNFNHHYNWLGVGITDRGKTKHSANWFNGMYYESSVNGMKFAREKYYSNFPEIMASSGGFQITGMMGGSHQAKIHVTVRPLDKEDFCAPIKKLLAKS